MIKKNIFRPLPIVKK